MNSSDVLGPKIASAAILQLKKFTRRFLPEIRIALETVLLKLHAKLAPGWALIRWAQTGEILSGSLTMYDLKEFFL